MTPPQNPAAWVWLARIRRPQGRKGEVFADILTDFPEKFAQRKRLWLLAGEGAPGVAAPREVELASHWLHKGGLVLHFAGIESISAAESLAGLIVAIPASDRAPLAPGEFHIADLIGCTVIDIATNPPREIGTIENVERSAGPVPLLMVRAAKGEVLVPFAESFVRKIEIENARVEMALPEGLVDLN